MIVEFENCKYNSDDAVKELKQLIRSFLTCDEANRYVPDVNNSLKLLAVMIALKVTDSVHPKGDSRLERCNYFIALLPDNKIAHLPFIGTIASMDFSDSTFGTCRFDHVRWANCKFSENTKFINCHFVGGSKSNCEDLGKAQWDNLTTDEDAKSFIKSSQIEEGKKEYTEEDLRSDYCHVINKFLGKGGLGFSTIAERNIKTGTIRMSKNADPIIDEIKRNIVTSHHVSGSTEPVLGVMDGAKEAIKFYAANNVFTGPLLESYDRLKNKLNLL